VPLVEQELFTLLEHISSPSVFGGVRVTRSLVLCVCFVDRCLSFYMFFSTIYKITLKQKDEQHGSLKKPRVNSGAREE
jgi:hypothetical protein